VNRSARCLHKLVPRGWTIYFNNTVKKCHGGVAIWKEEATAATMALYDYVWMKQITITNEAKSHILEYVATHIEGMGD
jgi:hypothetical protein